MTSPTSSTNPENSNAESQVKTETDTSIELKEEDSQKQETVQVKQEASPSTSEIPSIQVSEVSDKPVPSSIVQIKKESELLSNSPSPSTTPEVESTNPKAQSDTLTEQAGENNSSPSSNQAADQRSPSEGGDNALNTETISDNLNLDPQEPPRKRDRTMAEFVLMMDQYAPIIPDLVTDYYLTQAGFDCDDYRVKRVLALATQKFISDIASDAYSYAQIRNQTPKDRKSSKGKKTTLIMDDLSPALREYGINIKKPDYYL